MKFCKHCGIVLENENTDVCSVCAAQQPTTTVGPELPADTNPLAGIVGAALFALAGGLLYFIVYQIGFIAGIIGLATFFLAGFGFDLFAKTKGRKSTVRLVTSIIVTIAVLLLAEYVSMGYSLYTEIYKTANLGFFDALADLPEWLDTYPELNDAFAEDIIMMFIFTGVAVVSDIFAKKKANKSQL